jgi:hypothetical protein
MAKEGNPAKRYYTEQVGYCCVDRIGVGGSYEHQFWRDQSKVIGWLNSCLVRITRLIPCGLGAQLIRSSRFIPVQTTFGVVA